MSLTGTKAYVYTLTKNGGFKEWHGTFRESKYGRCYIFDKDGGGYLTSVPEKEGVVYHSCIWYREPNPDQAKKEFSAKTLKIRDEMMEKCKRYEQYILKGNYQ